MDKQLQDPNEGPAWSRPFGPIHLQTGEDPWHGVRGPPFDSPGHKRAINPGDERSLTVTRGHPVPQVRPCDRPGRYRFPS